MDPFARLILAALGFAFLAGLVLIVVGRRGRRLNDHPHCRRCRYDLVGREPLPARCPECGSELTASRISRGLRARRPAFLWFGRVLVLVTLAAVGWFGVLAMTGNGWIRHAPTSALAWVVASSTDAARNDAIAGELERRWTAAAPLDPQAETPFITAALNARDNRALAWNRTWQSLMGRACMRPTPALTTELIDRYLDNAAEITLDLRRRVGRNGPIRFTVTQNPSRGTEAEIIVRYQRILATLISGSTPRVLHDESFEPGVGGMQVSASSHGSFSMDLPPLPPGKHRIKLDYDYSASMAGRSRLRHAAAEIEVEVLESASAVVLVTDPALDPAGLIRSFNLRPRFANGGWQPEVSVMFDKPLACTLAVDLLLRRRRADGTTEDVKISSHTYEKGVAGGYGEILSEAIPVLYRRETLVLRPNPALVQAVNDEYEVWGKEIVFENIELDWSEAIAEGRPIPPEAP